MKKIILLLSSTFCILHSAFSQTPGEWTWMNGDSLTGQSAVYGTQGIPAPANHPGAMYEPCEWTDQQGNFWLYGGIGVAGIFSDMWVYNVTSNQWTWVKGPGTVSQVPSYGTQGVASPTNTPGFRAYGIVTWVDASNTLWMFGGWSSSDNNDLWKYDIATNEWTWINGDTFTGGAGSYGIIGVASPTNYPPARLETGCSWTDNANNLWLFGGESTLGEMNDMWKFDIAAGQWTWMHGSNTVNAVDVYGALGVSNPANTPGARQCYTHFKDLAGNLWLFGGTAYNPSAYNDLWKYTVATNEWTWMYGPNIQGDPGSYGTKCVAAASNLPSNRYENRSCWTDQCGNFYVFGGTDYPINDVYNDLWLYNTTSNLWTWVGGEQIVNSNGLFGTIGVSSPFNEPPSRTGSSSWMDVNGNLWLFGGFSGNFTQRGDLWRFVPDPNCGGCILSTPTANFTANDTTICPGSCVSFTNLSSGATSYQWLFPGGSPSSDSTANPANICYSNTGSYDVTLTASNGVSFNTYTLPNYINVFPAAAVPAITQIGDTLFATLGYVGYQWYDSSAVIPGATNYYYIATHSGNYNIIVTDENGCQVGAGIINVIATAPSNLPQSNEEVSVFPNPAHDNITVTIVNGQSSPVCLKIYNSIGEEIYFSEEKNVSRKFSKEILLKDFADGIYLLQIKSQSGIAVRKFIIQKS